MVVRFVYLLAICVPVAAAASPAAEQLFEDGRAALTAGKLDDACDAFRRSNALEPRVGTLLNLGDCEERRHHVSTAWAAFADAAALAKRDNDPRAAEADRRAKVLEPRRAFLVIAVPSAAAAGTQVYRDATGDPVDPAEWNRDVPVDAGTYNIRASAPSHLVWSGVVTAVDGQHVRIDVPALKSEVRAALPVDIIRPRPPAAIPRSGVGALIGFDSDGDLIGGVRGVISLAQVGRNSIRISPQILFGRFGDMTSHTNIYALGLAGEYVVELAPQAAVAAGIGIGMDIDKDDQNDPVSTQGWFEARVTPTVHLGRFDLGLQLRLVYNQRAIEIGELGLDYLF